MNNRDPKILKLLGLLFGVYLILFFAVIVPFHHHADHRSHDDCAICAVAALPFIVTNVNFDIGVIFVFFLIVIFSRVIIQSFRKENRHSHSPPSLFLNHNI